MTKKLFTWLSLMTVFLTLLWSCQQELLHSEQEYDSQLQKTTVERLLREELDKKHPLVIKKLNQLYLQKPSVNGRIYTDTENDFSINTDEAYFVQDAKGTKTYTFKVERDAEKEEGSLENLILKDIGEGNFFAFFIKYDATALGNSREKPLSPEELTHHISLYSIGKKTSSEIFGKLDSCPMVFYPVGTYVYVSGTKCVEGLHDYGEPCAYLGTSNAATQGGYQVVYTITVQETSGNCSGGGFDPSSGSGTIGTTPTHGGGGGMPDVYDPCEKIKKSTNDTKYISNITDLEGKTSLDHEEGYRLGAPISGTGQTGTQNQLLQNLPGTSQVDMKIFSNTFAVMHTHYDGLYPIFSPGDILMFNNWIVWANSWNAIPTNTPKIPLNNLILTVVTSNGNYLLAFDGSIVESLPAYTQEQFDDLNKKYMEKLNKTHTNGNFNMEKVEKEFLKFVNEWMNMEGLKLYRVKSDGNYEISLSNLDGVKCP